MTDHRPQTADRYIPTPQRITRTTAEVAASFTPAQQAEVDDIRQIVDELRRQNPLANFPPSAEQCYLMGLAGFEWDFESDVYRIATEENDWGIAYRYPMAEEGLRLEGG